MGGYIHRDFDSGLAVQREDDEENPEPLQFREIELEHKKIKEHDAYTRYKQTRKALVHEKDLLKPFMNIWPKYPSQLSFLTDFKYEVFVEVSKIDQMIEHIHRVFDSEPDLLNKDKAVQNFVLHTSEMKNIFIENAEVNKLPAKLKDHPNDHILSNHAYNPAEQFQKVLYHR